MKEILVIYKDNSQEILKLKNLKAIRFHGNFMAIDETNTSVLCLFDVKQIIFKQIH